MATRTSNRFPDKPTPPVLHDVADESSRHYDKATSVKLHGETRPLHDREALIAEAAYRRAEQRGFTPGQEIDDWLAAEKEIDAGAADASGGSPSEEH